VLAPKLTEMVLCQLSKNAVIHTHNRSCSWAVVDEANLTKIVARLNLLLLNRLLHVVADGDFTFATGNKAKELLILIVLLKD
jgi:hypothetical protein